MKRWQFVVNAWSKAMLEKNPTTVVTFLADDTGAFASSFGLLFDLTPILGGSRAKRCVSHLCTTYYLQETDDGDSAAIIVKDGKITKLSVEEDPSVVTVSGAAAILAAL